MPSRLQRFMLILALHAFTLTAFYAYTSALSPDAVLIRVRSAGVSVKRQAKNGVQFHAALILV